jgi:hypothetical protein
MGLGPGLLRKNARLIGGESTAFSGGERSSWVWQNTEVRESAELVLWAGKFPVAVGIPAVEIEL